MFQRRIGREEVARGNGGTVVGLAYNRLAIKRIVDGPAEVLVIPRVGAWC